MALPNHIEIAFYFFILLFRGSEMSRMGKLWRDITLPTFKLISKVVSNYLKLERTKITY